MSEAGPHQPPPGEEPAPAFRLARAADLPRLVELLADDALGAKRERFVDPLPESYARAFAAIERDPNQELWVACEGESVIGLLQITFIPYLTYQGGWRALIEGVRIARTIRARGAGRALVEWAIGRARARGCHMVQLTTDKARPDALRFYLALGFVASHEGMKLLLAPPGGSPPAAGRT